MTLLRPLADVDVPCSKSERPGHRLLLVLQGCTRQVEVHAVLADLLLLGWNTTDSEPGVVSGQERDAVVWIVGHLPIQDPGPEPRERQRSDRIEADRKQLTSHS